MPFQIALKYEDGHIGQMHDAKWRVEFTQGGRIMDILTDALELETIGGHGPVVSLELCHDHESVVSVPLGLLAMSSARISAGDVIHMPRTIGD